MHTHLSPTLAGLALFGALAISPTLLAAAPPTAPPQRSAPTERVDFGESARAASEVSRFLQQPKFGEAVAHARSSKEATDEASRNPSEFLMKQGVMVPRGVDVKFEPTGGGGAASKVKVEITIRCCPGSITIIVSW